MTVALPEGQPVYAIDMESLCDTGQQFTIEQLAPFYLDIIRKIQRSGPYYFCGYSFGGLVAYEMAMRLIDEGDSADLVALLDAANPALLSNLSQTDAAQFHKTYLIDRLKKYALQLVRGDFKALRGTRVRFHRRPSWKVLHARNQERISDRKETAAENCSLTTIPAS